MTWISGYIDKSTYRLICDVARRLGKSPAAIVGEIVERWIHEQSGGVWGAARISQEAQPERSHQ